MFDKKGKLLKLQKSIFPDFNRICFLLMLYASESNKVY